MIEAIEKATQEISAMSDEELVAHLEEHRFHTFMEDVASGKAQLSELEDALRGYSNSMGMHWFAYVELHDWLGITKEECDDLQAQRKTIQEIAKKYLTSTNQTL